MITIENLLTNSDQIPTVAEWLFNEWGHAIPNSSIGRAQKSLSSEPGSNGLPLSFIALDSGLPAGIARLVSSDMDTKPELTPWLASVFVHEEYRGTGIGSHLCTEIVTAAQRLGFEAVYLFTRNKEKFYARQGWKVFERDIYQNREVVIMRKELHKA